VPALVADVVVPVEVFAHVAEVIDLLNERLALSEAVDASNAERRAPTPKGVMKAQCAR
jgi:hypothetical protein